MCSAEASAKETLVGKEHRSHAKGPVRGGTCVPPQPGVPLLSPLPALFLSLPPLQRSLWTDWFAACGGLLRAMVCSNPGDVTAPRREERGSCSSRDI